MKLKKSSAYLSYRIWALEIVSGIILLCLAFWISMHADISNAAQRLSSTVNYVKEQCIIIRKWSWHQRTKSLMRIMESAEYINRNLASDMEKSGFEEPDQTLLENYAKESYVTGILLLSPQGAVEQEYHTDERNVWDLYENIEAEALLVYGISQRRRMHPELTARMVPTLTWQQWEERTGQESLLPITIHPRSTAAFLSILWSSF